MLTGINPDNETALLGSRMQSKHKATLLLIFKLELFFFPFPFVFSFPL
jgi:hypothetical protein